MGHPRLLSSVLAPAVGKTWKVVLSVVVLRGADESQRAEEWI